MPELVVVCEAPVAEAGSDPSHDIRALAALLNECSSDCEIQVEACGGSEGLGAVAAYIAGVRGPGVVCAHVRDRDYQPLSRADNWSVDDKRRFMWRRHEFENYLLQPEVVVTAMEHLAASVRDRPGRPPAWADALPRSVGEVEAAVGECAEAVRHIEALQMTIWGLVQDVNAVRRVQMQVPPSPGAGGPGDPEACVAYLRSECARVRQVAQELADCDALDPAAAESAYCDQLAALSAPSYPYLRDFGGRELLAGFHRWLANARGASLRRDTLRRELADAVAIAYRAIPGLFDPDDFRQLAGGVRALAGLPPCASA